MKVLHYILVFLMRSVLISVIVLVNTMDVFAVCDIVVNVPTVTVCSDGGYVRLPAITFTESSGGCKTAFNWINTTETLVLKTPANGKYAFNLGATITVTFAASQDITAVSGVVSDANTITISITQDGNLNQSGDIVTVYGIEIMYIGGGVGGPDDIYYDDAASTGTFDGLVDLEQVATVTSVASVTYTASVDGNWTTGATWGGSAPTGSSCDDVTINSNVTIQAATTAVCGDLTVISPKQLTVSCSVAGGGSLTIYGIISNAGTINASGDQWIYLSGTGTTLGGTGTFTTFGIWINNYADYTLANSLAMGNLYISANGEFSISSYTYTLETQFVQYGVMNLNSGIFEIKAASQTYTLPKFNHNQGTYFWNKGSVIMNLNDDDWYNVRLGKGSDPSAIIEQFYNLDIANDFTIDADVEFRPWNITGPPPGVYAFNVNVGGDFINNGTLTPRYLTTNFSTKFIFDGTGDQEIGGASNSTFYRMKVDKATGTLTLNPGGGITTVDGQLELTDGTVDLNGTELVVNRATGNVHNSGNLITRANGAILCEDETGASNVRWYAMHVMDHVFPFEKADATYIPFVFSPTAGAAGHVNVYTWPTVADNTPYGSVITDVNNVVGADNSANTVDRFWSINPESAITANMSFYYANSEVPTGGEDDLVPQRWSSGWQPPLATNTSVPGSNYSKVDNVSTFSPWALARNLALLPVELISFSGKMVGETIELTWSTASEKNNDFFTIEKSSDNFYFEEIEKIQGVGNSNKIHAYKCFDSKPNPNVNYYRLKQTDFNNDEKYIGVVAVIYEQLNNIKAFPNPTSGKFDIYIVSNSNGDLYVTLCDLVGKVILSQNVSIEKGHFYIPIDISNFENGNYFVKIRADQISYNQKIVKN